LNTGKLNIRNQELSLTKDLALIEHDYNDAKECVCMNAKLFEKILSQEMTGILKGKSAFSRRT
jgi:HlyD family secretion protein